jgi:hypothetical protein
LRRPFGVYGRKLNPVLSILVARPALPVSTSSSPTRRKDYSSSTHPTLRRAPSHRKPYRLQEKMRRTEQFSLLLRPTPHMPHPQRALTLHGAPVLSSNPKGPSERFVVSDSTRVVVSRVEQAPPLLDISLGHTSQQKGTKCSLSHTRSFELVCDAFHLRSRERLRPHLTAIRASSVHS